MFSCYERIPLMKAEGKNKTCAQCRNCISKPVGYKCYVRDYEDIIRYIKPENVRACGYFEEVRKHER